MAESPLELGADDAALPGPQIDVKASLLAAEPDHDWVLPFKAQEESPGIWRVYADVALEPGEYGWYVDLGTGPQSNGLFSFGVD